MFWNKKKIMIAVGLALVAAAIGVFALFKSYAGVGTGVVYDWKTGNILNDYQPTGTMPSGWDFVEFVSTLEDGSQSKVGLWVPVGSPMVGSRELLSGDKGEDVSALQTTLNLLRVESSSDPYFFESLPVNGIFDGATLNAVKKLQKYYGLEQTGIADYNFQASIYEQVTTPGVTE